MGHSYISANLFMEFRVFVVVRYRCVDVVKAISESISGIYARETLRIRGAGTLGK